MRCGRRVTLTQPFVVINADDFYGRAGLAAVVAYMQALPPASTGAWCLAGYHLAGTLSPMARSRAGCAAIADGRLISLDEHSAIAREADGVIHARNRTGAAVTLADDQPVSMNLWGFTPDVVPLLEQALVDFIGHGQAPMAGESYLPMVVSAAIAAGQASAAVLAVASPWYGVTYQADVATTSAALAQLHADGVYPPSLLTNADSAARNR